MYKQRIGLLSLIVFFGLAACAPPPMVVDPEPLIGTATPVLAQPLPTRQPPELIGTLEPAPGIIGTPVTGEAPTEVVAAMIAALSELTGVPAAEIVVLSDEAVVWPDGGLGCPEPGVGYTQVQVEGYRVLLVAGGQVYDYRVGERPENFRLCQSEGGGGLVSIPLPTDGEVIEKYPETDN